MGISESDVRAWVGKACAVVDGASLDYLTLCVPSSRTQRSYIEHANVRVGDKATQQVADEVWGHIDDITQSAANEGKSEAVIRVNLYRNKAPAGSKVFRTDTAPYSGNAEDDADANLTGMAGALVGTIKELRYTIKDLLDTVNQSAKQGWIIAGEAIKAERATAKENAELMVVVAAKDDTPSPMNQIAIKGAEALIEGVKMKAMMEMQAQAMQAASNPPQIKAETKKEGE